MTTLAQSKIIREYPLPCGPEVVCYDFTGSWQVLRVEARFAKPNLYVLEDAVGPRTSVEFAVVNTNAPFDGETVLADGNSYLGSYLVHVPTNVLHVFGPTSAQHAENAAATPA
jgi:hypothetical protein